MLGWEEGTAAARKRAEVTRERGWTGRGKMEMKGALKNGRGVTLEERIAPRDEAVGFQVHVSGAQS